MKRYLIIDGQNVAHAANAAGVLTVGDVEVQAIYGFMRTMHKLLAIYGGYTPLVLWDGASWRNLAFPDYKANREKDDTPAARKLKETRSGLRKQIPAIRKGLTLLGVDQIIAANMEADDLAAILTKRFGARGDRITLVTADQDWVQLVTDTVTWFDQIREKKVKLETLFEKYGVNSVEQFLEMKALKGDLGDNIPGVGGIGEKGAIEFLQAFGSFANFSNMVMDGSVDPAALPKKYRELAESEDKRMAFSRNLWLMDLNHPQRPEPVNLRVMKGEASIEKFSAFCRHLNFQSILKTLDNWLSVFPGFQVPWEEEAA